MEYAKNTKVINHSFNEKRVSYDTSGIESFHASLKKKKLIVTDIYIFKCNKFSYI